MKRTKVRAHPRHESHIVEPPIIDMLRYEAAIEAYVVTFVPTDETSPEQTEMVSIPRNSPEGRRFQIGLSKISRLMKMDNPPIRVVHAGGDDFGFYFDNDVEVRLSAISMEKTLRVFDELRYLSQNAENAFCVQRTPATD